MKLLKSLIPLLMVGLTAANVDAQVVGQETAFERQLNTLDDQPVREFVESKENIDVQEKARNLEISGDVRFEWRSIQEKGIVLFTDDYSPMVNEESSSLYEVYRNLRGDSRVDAAGIPLSTNDFDVEFNLKIRYTFQDAWAKAHLQFDNPAGIRGRNPCITPGVVPVFNREGSDVIKKLSRDSRWALKGSGEVRELSLKRAYLGYNIYADGRHRLDIEIGRQKLDDVFDSEIEFSNRFDGVLFRFASAVEEAFDWYITAGAFVIDERVNHFGYVTEIGFLDIYETGVDLRYSFIDWKKRGKNRCFIFNPLGTQFQNSQITLTYTFAQTWWDYEFPVEFYSGFLINHAARRKLFTHRKRKNLGWYAGFYINNVREKGDWAIDIEYIAVQAQAVPEQDVGSIGRGNILDENLLDIVDESFTSESSDSPPTSGIIGYFPRRGNTNFVGWRFEFLYAITDNFSLDFIYEFSDAEDRHIGGPHRYRDFEIEAIYAF